MDERTGDIAEVCLAGGEIDAEQIGILRAKARTELYDVLYWANKIREKHFGDEIRICCIVPGRLGGCKEDCRFCGQSARYESGFCEVKSLTDEEILDAARQAQVEGVGRFGIVYSGRAVSEKELGRLEGLIERISGMGLQVCASLGVMTVGQAERLVGAGLTGYNHNLETSERHFPEIVTTHTYADRVATIKAAKEAGLCLCAGGIFGIGESEDDRIDMALELRRLCVDIVPMNFLHPIEGTPFGQTETLRPVEILRIIVLYRFILPRTTLKIAGGRVLNLRDMQSWMFYAGANAILSGNYLTTSGRAVEEDMQMLSDLGLRATS